MPGLAAVAAKRGARQAAAARPTSRSKNHDGTEISLAKLRGRVVLVNFWATWCDTCVVEMQSLDRLASQLKDKPFTLLAVSVDDDWERSATSFRKARR